MPVVFVVDVSVTVAGGFVGPTWASASLDAGANTPNVAAAASDSATPPTA